MRSTAAALTLEKDLRFPIIRAYARFHSRAPGDARRAALYLAGGFLAPVPVCAWRLHGRLETPCAGQRASRRAAERQEKPDPLRLQALRRAAARAEVGPRGPAGPAAAQGWANGEPTSATGRSGPSKVRAADLDCRAADAAIVTLPGGEGDKDLDACTLRASQLNWRKTGGSAVPRGWVESRAD